MAQSNGSWFGPYLRNKVFTLDLPKPSLLDRIAGQLTERRLSRGQPLLSERLLEYPLLFQALNPKAKTVLEFGCCDGLMSMHLAAMGYKVTGLDFQSYYMSHPNFTFVQSDIMRWDPPQDGFDAVVSISTVEHVGLGGYGDPVNPDGDRMACQKLYTAVRPGGALYLAVPAGKAATRRNMRIYDSHTIDRVMPAPGKVRWFAKPSRAGSWGEVAAEQIDILVYEDYDSTSPAQGLAFLVIPK